MSLLKFWKVERDSILQMNVERIIKIAGDGNLKDGNKTSEEFRIFLTEVEGEKLAEYAKDCILGTDKFKDSGQILQDIINEIGRRLGFTVTNGRYAGRQGENGYDGIWKADNESIVVEVKTTTAYAIDLNVAGKYRDRLVEEGTIQKDSPILFVIGRNDTVSLEEQIRGSKHAWSTRIIGISALLKLMEINLRTSSQEITAKIHKILRPFEYTRIDEIVDVIFTATEDRDTEIANPVEDELDGRGNNVSPERTPQEEIIVKKEQILERFNKKVNQIVVRRRASLYSDSDDEIHAVIAVSKFYERKKVYWYAYHRDPQRGFISESKSGYMILGMTDSVNAMALPFAFLEKHWENLNSTIRANGSEYKHIFVLPKNDRYYLVLNGSGGLIDLSEYVF